MKKNQCYECRHPRPASCKDWNCRCQKHSGFIVKKNPLSQSGGTIENVRPSLTKKEYSIQ